MGYKTPLVCKEVYLPVEPSFLLNEPTIDEYNKHYGLDLLSILNVVYDADNNDFTFKEPENTKVYLVLKDYGSKKLSCVRQANSSLFQLATESNEAVYSFSDITRDSFGFGLVFHFTNGKPEYLTTFEI